VTKSSVSQERQARETDRLRQVVNAHRAQKAALSSATAQQPAAEQPQAPKPKRTGLLRADRPTEIPGGH
jgi:hypothetical protein